MQKEPDEPPIEKEDHPGIEAEVLDPDQITAIEIIDTNPPGTLRRTLYLDATISCKDPIRLPRIKKFINSELERRGYPAHAEPASRFSDINEKFNRMMDIVEEASHAAHKRRMKELDDLFAKFKADEEKLK